MNWLRHRAPEPEPGPVLPADDGKQSAMEERESAILLLREWMRSDDEQYRVDAARLFAWLETDIPT